VLLADDDDILAELVQFRLEGDGHEVIVAGNGEDALNLAMDRKPDLIILDSMMPIKSGVSAFQKIIAVKSKQSVIKQIAVDLVVETITCSINRHFTPEIKSLNIGIECIANTCFNEIISFVFGFNHEVIDIIYYKEIAVCSADHCIAAWATIEVIPAISTDERIIAFFAKQRIIASKTVNRVVALGAKNLVGAISGTPNQSFDGIGFAIRDGKDALDTG